MAMKRIYAREEYCLACRLCEIHCLVQHSRSKKIVKAFRQERDTVIPGVQVEQSGRTSFALQCRHCDDAPCLEACMTGAMHRDAATGTVLSDPDRCVGCWMCVMVCPVGAVLRGKENKVASKCDLCLGEKTPVCVLNCPNEAIVYEER
jgi:carbon-monoxide dehydrogenase iron sulfur subunit